MNFPHFYPITDEKRCAISPSEQIREFAIGGAKIAQMRCKTLFPVKFLEEVEKALVIANEFDLKVIVNDRVDIAATSKAHGVHLGQTDLSPSSARAILGEKAIIGISTHNIPQVTVALTEPVDYIAFGPVFGTKTKENPDETVGPAVLKEVKKIVGDIPLIAIGGISRANFHEVLAAGADSCAVISDLFRTNEKISEIAKYYEFV